MGSLAILAHMIDAELRHTLQESEHSDRNDPRSYAAGFDAGRAAHGDLVDRRAEPDQEQADRNPGQRGRLFRNRDREQGNRRAAHEPDVRTHSSLRRLPWTSADS